MNPAILAIRFEKRLAPRRPNRVETSDETAFQGVEMAMTARAVTLTRSA